MIVKLGALVILKPELRRGFLFRSRINPWGFKSEIKVSLNKKFCLDGVNQAVKFSTKVLEYQFSGIKCVCWPKTYRKYKHLNGGSGSCRQ
jgi:hypothetical protein